MKTTPFTDKHIALGAKMHEFAGYNMPIEYSGIIEEHLTVCHGVGVLMSLTWVNFGLKGLPLLNSFSRLLLTMLRFLLQERYSIHVSQMRMGG